jgi:hypothetical protein
MIRPYNCKTTANDMPAVDKTLKTIALPPGMYSDGGNNGYKCKKN